MSPLVGFGRCASKPISRQEYIVPQRDTRLYVPTVDVDASKDILPFASGDEDYYQSHEILGKLPKKEEEG
jgi:hypothetical protein